MLFYLHSAEELADVFRRLGYEYDTGLIPRTVDYYLARTAHGSTLSAVVHSWVLSRQDRSSSWRFFLKALHSDVADVQGGTTLEGIHLGAMAGVVDLVQRGYSGLETREDTLRFHPNIPAELGELAFAIRYRGHWDLQIRCMPERFSVGRRDSAARPVTVHADGQSSTVEPGGVWICRL